jgi:hypothetical protein
MMQQVTNMPLEPEPEVLSAEVSSSHEIMLPRLLVKGSPSRCPRGIWEEKIDQFRMVREAAGLDVEAEELAQKNRKRKKRTPCKKGSSSARQYSTQPADGALDSLEDESSLEGQSETTRPPRKGSIQRVSTFSGLMANMAVKTAVLLTPAQAGKKDVGPTKKPPDEGYCKTARGGGISAMRVPLQNIGGYVENSKGAKVAPLQLVVDAVAATHDYEVFGSRTLEIMLQFKWKGFAFRGFLKDLFFFIVHLLLATVYNIFSSQSLHLTVDEITGVS